jgi:uncharacterized membrane protein YccC
VPDWLPSLVNAGRTFVAIGIVEIFWIMTEWPNGALAITFTAIGVLLLAPQGDRAYAAAIEFAAGTALGTVFTAIIAFAVPPGLETFEAFSLVLDTRRGSHGPPGRRRCFPPWSSISCRCSAPRTR